jgi:hypothetical protein
MNTNTAPATTETPLETTIRRQFAHLSNRQLVARINRLPDFGWDDEGFEIARRVRTSNGKLECKMEGNTLLILKDEQ